MEAQIEAEIAPEQREQRKEEPLLDRVLESPPPLRPRGRPWVKGQSGNPAGRPARAHTTARVAEYLIGQKTIPLTKKLIALALDGDKTAMRLCLDRIAPPRRDADEWLGLALAEDTDELREVMNAVANAAEKGAITAAQSEALVRLVKTVLGAI